MNVYAQPDEKTIKAFCQHLEKALLEATARGDPVCLSDKMYMEDVTAGFECAPIVVDAIFRGIRLTAEIGEPARKRIGKSRLKVAQIIGKIGELSHARPI